MTDWTRPGWDDYFLGMAEAAKVRADCRRRKVGCVIVDELHRFINAGYNGAPAGMPGCLEGACPRGLLSYEQVQAFSSYDEGPGRCISIHAELNAMLNAPRSCRGGTAYITDEPCPTCRKLLHGAGIVRVVWPGGEWLPGQDAPPVETAVTLSAGLSTDHLGPEVAAAAIARFEKQGASL